MEQTQSSSEPCLEEDPRAATVGGRGDRLPGRISQAQDSSGWRTCLEEEVMTAVTVAITTTRTISTVASAGMTSPSKTSTGMSTGPAGGLTRQGGGGATLQGMGAVMQV